MTREVICMAVSAVLFSGCAGAPPPLPEKPSVGSIVRLDPAFDSLVPKDARIEKVAGGFQFTEGPLWRPDNRLWFSDVIGNVVRSVTPEGQVTVLIEHSGGSSSPPAGSYLGSNGMAADKDGTVLLCQHAARRIVRVTRDMKLEPVVEKFESKQLNSPNDLVLRADGSIYFTDPPFGLLKQDDDPAKEIKFNGVYRYANGKTQLLAKDLSRPNGIGFSPDEKILYVSNCDAKQALWMKYDVAAGGSISNGRVFVDLTGEKGDGCPDGLKLDSLGNVYATGPGGLWVFSPEGKRLGTFKLPEIPANAGWGEDGKTLYITAETGVYRVKLTVAGLKPAFP
jgi:gluconolactonase